MTSGRIQSIDVCTSAFNEEEVIEKFVYATIESFDKNPTVRWRLIVVDNGSNDATWSKLLLLAKVIPNLTAIRLTKNFGFERAILAALDSSNADASIMMASDMQDNPEYFPLFLSLFHEGYENIYQVVTDRPSISPLRRILTQLFYKFGASLTSGGIVPNGTDYRMISRRLREALLKTPDRSRLNRAILTYFAHKSISIEIPRTFRTTGKSKSTFRFTLALGLRGIFSNSKKLLDYIGLLSVVVVGIMLVTLAIAVVLFIYVGVPFGGFGTIVGLLILLFTLNFLSLGVIAQYLAIVTEIIQNRPLYVVDEKIN